MFKPKINELYTLEKGGDIDSRVIVSVTPITMSIMVPKAEDGTYSVMARVTWLCKDRTGVLFCLTTTYAAENDNDEEFLVTCPLSNEKYFIHNSLTADILMSSLDHFLTDFGFKFKFPENIHNSNETEIYCQAFEKSLSDDPSNDKLHKIMVTPEVYSTLSYVDSYIVNANYNTSELYWSLVFGTDESSDTTIFAVDNVEVKDVFSFSNTHINSKDYKALIALVHVTHGNKDIKGLDLLMIVLVYKKIKINKRIKKNNIDLMIDKYMKEDDHYISKFSFDSTINSEDKNYTFIKATNNNKEGILVSLTTDIKDEIMRQVNNIISRNE